MRRIVVALAGVLLAILGSAVPACAHPHIFIDARATIVFNDAGEVTAIKHEWKFDEAFSAWSIQGLDTNGDGVTSEQELQGLADENMTGLAAYSFYTFVGEGEAPDLGFKHLPDPRQDYADGRTILHFGLQLDQPYRIRDMLEVSISDPEYYVAITFEGPQAVSLENAPAGCTATIDPPKQIPPALADKLYSLGADVTELPPDLAQAMRGMQGSILVHCPNEAIGAPVAAKPAATNALDAVNQIGQARAIPFGGPPKELGFGLPTTGVLGWIAAEQKEFYQLLTNALSRLKTDNTALLVLGSLSFFYGIFHAAGPGHGKVVISSYVLANESQYRQGVILSFASAMLASLVAVVFILVAALVLNLTGDAMGNAANWIGIGSYAMVALLGLWLMARKIFGFGHRHDRDETAPDDHADFRRARQHLYAGGPDQGHDHGDEHRHHHAHDHDHGELALAGPPAHSHVAVMPDQVSGDWREALGVVLTIGMRPCSGALIVLVFALSQGLLWAGIVSVFLMGLGTALTVTALATLAMTAKGLARRLSGGRQGTVSAVIWWAELFGAFLVFAFGVLLVIANVWG